MAALVIALALPVAGVAREAVAATAGESELARAAATGEPVEVTRLTSQTQRVVANPDGTFTAEVTPRPVRVRDGDGWRPVDTTLVRRSDGVIAPVAAAVDLELSGGGDQTPLVQLGWGGKELSLDWPDALPRPVLHGNTATYPDVLDGVDLVMSADVAGFSEVLVVKTPAAATGMVRSPVTLPIHTTGVSVQPDQGGGLRAVDGSGTQWFQAPAPTMWDSSGSGTTGSNTVAGGGPGLDAHSSVVGVTVDDNALVLTPDEELLTAPDTQYPVYVDPGFTANPSLTMNRSGWVTVWKEFPNSPHWNSSDPAKVGHAVANPSVTVRSLFQFNVASLRGKHILRSTFQTFESYAWSCSPRNVELWQTTGINSGTTWNNQPRWQARLDTRNVAYGYSSACSPDGHEVDFNAKAAVESVARAGGSTLTLGLRSPNESDPFYWKKFHNTPHLFVEYNTRPNVPTGLTTNPGGLPNTCARGADRPFISTATPELLARATDPDGNRVRVEFEWWITGGSAKVGSVLSVGGPSGQVFHAQIPVGAFHDGQTFSWRARARDSVLDLGGFSDWCEYTIDTSAPDKAPGVSSDDYPTDGFHGGRGTPGQFTFSPNGVSDVASYLYGINQDDPKTPVAASGSGHTATVTVVPPTDGRNTLYVRSKDHVGNLSPVTPYTFLVDDASGPAIHWRLDDGSGTSATDSSGNGHDGTLSGGVSWTDGQVDGAAELNGTSGQISTTDQVIRTDRSFAVTAWARMDGTTTGQYILASKDGVHHSGFTLKYHAGDWTFAMAHSDSTSPVYDIASTPAGPPGVWTHLTAVFDAQAGTISLYVNGVLARTVSHTSTWNAPGAMVVGRATADGIPGAFWDGAVDDVRVYDRIIFDDEIREIANGSPVLAGRWKLDEGFGQRATDSSGNGRDGGLQGGASWGLGFVGTSGVELDGVDGRVGIGEVPFVCTTCGEPIPIPGPGPDPLAMPAPCDTCDPVVRTDLSFTVAAWVRLDNSAHAYTAVSQDGEHQSGFSLGYSPEGKWSFTMMSSDTDNPAHDRVSAPVPPQLGVWTHLTGVYDAPLGQLRLYVNGVLAEQTDHAGAWDAHGGTQIGRGEWNGSPADWWSGGIDDVRLYRGVVSDRDIRDFLDRQ